MYVCDSDGKEYKLTSGALTALSKCQLDGVTSKIYVACSRVVRINVYINIYTYTRTPADPFLFVLFPIFPPKISRPQPASQPARGLFIKTRKYLCDL